MRTAEITFPQPKRVRLYRGVSAKMVETIAREGVSSREPRIAPGHPSLYALATSVLPGDLLVELHAADILAHCENGSSESGSPWVSWSTAFEPALRFASADGTRAIAWIVETELNFVKQFITEALDEDRDGVFEDDEGRVAVVTERLRVLSLDAAQPRRLSNARSVARREAEVLLRGDVPPHRLRIRRFFRRYR